MLVEALVADHLGGGPDIIPRKEREPAHKLSVP